MFFFLKVPFALTGRVLKYGLGTFKGWGLGLGPVSKVLHTFFGSALTSRCFRLADVQLGEMVKVGRLQFCGTGGIDHVVRQDFLVKRSLGGFCFVRGRGNGKFFCAELKEAYLKGENGCVGSDASNLRGPLGYFPDRQRLKERANFQSGLVCPWAYRCK